MRCSAVLIAAVACCVMIRAAGAEEPALAEERAFRAAATRVAAAVVRIEPVVVAAATGGGVIEMRASSGLVVDPAGLVVTTEVALPAGAREAVVVLPDGRRIAARPLARDAIRGLVLLETDPLPETPQVELAPRAGLEAGQWTIAVSRGWSAAEASMAVGILSAVDRGWGLVVQTDASVSSATYGGPLVDIRGRVIGVVAPLPAESASLVQDVDLSDAGIGFAVPLEDVLANLPQLRAGRSLEPGLLGVGYRSRDAINGPPEIAAVRQGSPAARAGLRPGDRIVAVGGTAVTRIADVRRALVPRHAGEEIELEAARDPGDRVVARATLVAALPVWRRPIIGVVAADDAGAATAGEPVGPRIDWVLPEGPAAGAGIAPGSRVTAVELAGAGATTRVPTPDTRGLAGALAAFEPEQTVRLVLDRAGDVSMADVRLAAMIAAVPAEGPPPPVAAAGPAPTAVRLVRLTASDLRDPPLAVVPAGADPVPVLVWCGQPRGRVEDADATVWKAAVAATGVAVILPGSGDPREWRDADVDAVLRGLRAAVGVRAIDASRVAVAGAGPGGGFAWLVAAALGDVCRGVAVVDAPLPTRARITAAEPSSARWILLGGHERGAARRADDARRLEAAGHAVGGLTAASDGGPPAALLCRWAALLGLL
ncbi:MAG: S1C family serine protease [Planctomycetaceae bacterium]